MRKILIGFLALGTIFLLTLGSAHAYSFSFGDNVNYWPGYSNGSTDDAKDVIGSPNVLGGGGEIDDAGNITSIYVDYSSTSGLVSKTSVIFIDDDANGYWDYVLETAYGSNNVYQFDSDAFAYDYEDGYMMSVYPYSGDGNYRENHPAGVNWDTFENDSYALIDTFTFSALTNQYLYDDLKLNVGVDSSFTIAWTLICANDVMYERVPEPATMFLFGAGFIGIAAVGRKKIK